MAWKAYSKWHRYNLKSNNKREKDTLIFVDSINNCPVINERIYLQK